MSDIVERLRQPCHPDEPPSGVDLERREAADEIVKLRSSLFRVQNWLQDARAPLDQCIRETLEALDE